MTNYPWKRYWCRPDEHMAVDDDGFLVDPATWRVQLARSFEQFGEIRCLILLGEPGIGKSTALESEKDRLAAAGLPTMWVDLRRLDNQMQFTTQLTESPTWKEWLGGDTCLHLFLDGLDEGRLRISNLGDAIVDTLKDAPLDRLFFRISCRTADWPLTLQQELLALFYNQGEASQAVEVYELVPLRRDDVRAAAQFEGLNPDSFIEEVVEKGAGALAAIPVTLRLLLRLAKKGQLPTTRTELYSQGCLELCAEPHPKRREAAVVDDRFRVPEPAKLLAVACRVAALTQFSNRYVVYAGHDHADDGDLSVQDLIGEYELTDTEGRFFVDTTLVRHVLRCGLFSARGGPNRLGWVHQTYAEYLAARYLRNAPLAQVKSLLSRSDMGQEYLVPQLRQTSAWLAAMRPDVFQWVMQTEPHVVLHGDVQATSDAFRADLVGHLLEAVRQGRLASWYEFYRLFRRLKHPRLVEQLQPYFDDRNAPTMVRDLAINIALAAGEADLAGRLADIALDQTELLEIRVSAARSVAELGVPEVQRSLAPLATGEAGADPDDSLRAFGLMCMWPRFWSTTEFLQHLVPPRRDNFIGPYRQFLWGQVVANVPDRDLSHTLTVISESDNEHLLGILEGLIKRAWKLRADETVMLTLARVVIMYVQKHHQLPGGPRGEFTEQLNHDMQGRRTLLQAIVGQTEHSKRDVFALFNTGLARADDVLWLLEKIELAPQELQPLWVRLLVGVIRPEDSPIWSDLLAQVADRVPALCEAVAWMFEVWPLDSAKSRKHKAHHLWDQRRRRQRAPKPIVPPPRERLEAALQKVEGGEVKHWVNVCFSLALETTSVFLSWHTTLEGTPGWVSADPELKQRIIRAGLRYLVESSPGDYSWVGGNTFPYEVLAAYPAFRILATHDLSADLELRAWEAWAPALIAVLVERRDDAFQQIIRQAYSKAPEAVINCVLRMVEAGDGHAIYRLETCWDERLSAAVLQRLEQGGVDVQTRTTVSRFLIEQGHNQVIDWLGRELSRPQNDPSDDQWFVKTASFLLRFGGEGQWPAVRRVFELDAEVGQKVWLDVADEGRWHRVPILGALSEDSMGELALFVLRWFPLETDPYTEGPHQVTSREEAARLRNLLLSNLAARGTAEAVAVIQRLINAIPRYAEYFRWYLRDALEAAHRKAWAPASPRQVIQLLQDGHRRYVETDDHLLGVVTEALNGIQEYLHGPWTPVKHLWNDAPLAPLTPRDEHALSDFLADRLTTEIVRKGVVVNREVQIKPGTGSRAAATPGERTDLHVQAIAREPQADRATVLTLVIEVKGCWNRRVRKDMRSQLVARYLHGNGLRYGIYLVGWFLCDSWDGLKDPRKDRTPFKDFETAGRYFDEQALELTQEYPDLRVQAITLDLRLGDRVGSKS